MKTWEDVEKEVISELKEKSRAADAVYSFDTDADILARLQSLSKEQKEQLGRMRACRDDADGLLSQKELDMIAINTVSKMMIQEA